MGVLTLEKAGNPLALTRIGQDITPCRGERNQLSLSMMEKVLLPTMPNR
jgi:hypothetical protein